MSNSSTLQMLVDWANIGVVISLALSFVFGAASVFLGSKLGKLKDTEANAAQQNLELAVATQQERAAKAERALLELQERLTPLRLTNEQGMALSTCLSKMSIGAPVEIWYPANDRDMFDLANDLHMHGLSTFPSPKAASSGMFPFMGITVLANSINNGTPAARLIEVLQCASIPCTGGQSFDVPNGIAVIFVGHPRKKALRETSPEK